MGVGLGVFPGLTSIPRVLASSSSECPLGLGAEASLLAYRIVQKMLRLLW